MRSPAALVFGACFTLAAALAGPALAESAVAPDVPGQQFPDTGYVADPDTGPSGGIDIGARPPPPDAGGDPDAEPQLDTGTPIDAGGEADAEGVSSVPDGFLGPPELPEEPSSCATSGARASTVWPLGLLLGAYARRRAARRRAG